mmetsp:Transcript_31481/g.50881  ORF Transcript_31481/g.50881 Transcript_31481/m.50881 type:complete len:104 (-) Transcript_31481:142-453(-)
MCMVMCVCVCVCVCVRENRDGDIMMRFLPAFQAVNYMRQGLSPTLACEKALVPIALKFPSFKGGLVCMSKNGEHGAASHGWLFHYAFQDSSVTSPQVVAVPSK